MHLTYINIYAYIKYTQLYNHNTLFIYVRMYVRTYVCAYLLQTYFPAFKSCVQEGHGASIMCSYNAVNGVPSCANDFINNKITRDEWGFDGYIVSVHVYVC